jgi:hypothetical protein
MAANAPEELGVPTGPGVDWLEDDADNSISVIGD